MTMQQYSTPSPDSIDGICVFGDEDCDGEFSLCERCQTNRENLRQAYDDLENELTVSAAMWGEVTG